MSQKRYLTAKEAAAELGISVPTLYAYVSRGLIRSEETKGKSRARQYHLEDVQALKARKALRRNPAKAAETALHFGAPVLESAITLIKDGRLYYRGHDVTTLPQHHTFEAVATLIWQGELVANNLAIDMTPVANWDWYQTLWPHLANLTPVEAFQVVLPLAAAHDLAAYDLRQTAVIQTGARILSLLVAIATGAQPSQSIAGTIQHAWAPGDSQAESLIDMALIFCADHELNVSSFTARAVASAEATPYAAVIAGLSALQGRKHGGATERVNAFFQEVGAPEQAHTTITRRLKRGDRIPGFGHPLYPEGDPRGRELLAQVTAAYPDSPAIALSQQIVAEVEKSVGLKPTIDLALVTLARAAQLPAGAPLALFALGRTVGWIGHVIEQYQSGKLIRPRARYTGEQPR